VEVPAEEVKALAIMDMTIQRVIAADASAEGSGTAAKEVAGELEGMVSGIIVGATTTHNSRTTTTLQPGGREDAVGKA
jgi:hypothetical protein